MNRITREIVVAFAAVLLLAPRAALQAAKSKPLPPDAGAASSREIAVQTSAALACALDSAGAGDIVKLRPGNWTDVHLAVNRGGSAEKPLEISGESPGETIFTGSSDVVINAPYVTVDGLFFYQGTTKSDAVIKFNSHHGMVRNTAIVDYNPAAFDTPYYWVYFSGDRNLVERCYFKGKNNLQPLIGNALEGSRHNGVQHCYFKNIPYAQRNGREDIRVWGSGKFDPRDKDGAFFTIQGNLFEQADGEGSEIISLKSNYNQVLNNTIIATRGCINIRQGAHNVIKGNVILGRGVSQAQGVRISGPHNTVQGNYVSGCDFGIRVSCGEYVASALTANYKPHLKHGARGKTTADGRIATYPQVTDLTLSENVTVGIRGADLEVGFGYKKHWSEAQLVLLPEGCLIAGNRFVRPRGGDSVIGTIAETGPPLDQLRFAPNRYEGNHLVGGKNAFAAAAGGCQSEPLPAGWTETVEQGAFQSLAPADVGPGWVIALRCAGKFPMEDDDSCRRTSVGDEQPKKKRKR
jgi:poly(beta-D-mannuronate) lyase